jgi:murein DD-endopeptidase MepM/ murein hydrolase activator NlpD
MIGDILRTQPVLRLLLFLLLAGGSGCAAVGEIGPVERPVEEPSPPAATVVIWQVTPTAPESHPAAASTPYFTLSPEPSATPSAAVPTQEAARARVCTPLQAHTLADLREIVSFAYDPPPEGKDSGHHGIDFAYYRRGERLSIQGVEIQAVLSGKVASVSLNLPPYGYMVIIETPFDQVPVEFLSGSGLVRGESVYLLYAHMESPPEVQIGEQVACGQRLGAVGNTPPEWSSAPHLHLEARSGSSGALFADGMGFYSVALSDYQRDSYITWRTSGIYRLFDPFLLLDLGFDQLETGNLEGHPPD